MEVGFSENAEKELDNLDQGIRIIFIKHIEKISQMPPRRHIRFGVPFNIDEIGQGRIVYSIENEVLFVLHCFTTHKEYEKWYSNFR